MSDKLLTKQVQVVDQIMTLGINEESDVKGRSKIHNSCEQWLMVVGSDEE